MAETESTAERYRRENREIQLGKTVFTGSSLMEMFPINKLLEEHQDSTVIYNRGISGFVAAQLLEVIDVCVLDLKPAKVFINIGTNDLSTTNPIDSLMETYDKILSRIEEGVPGVVIYLMAYYPVNYEAAAEDMKENLKIRTNEKIRAANLQVEQLARRHGQRYIDINRNLMDGQGRLKAEYTIEGMHINEDGYRAVYPDLMAYVKE